MVEMLFAVEPEAWVTPLVPDREHEDMLREHAVDDEIGEAAYQELACTPAHGRADLGVLGHSRESVLNRGCELRTEVSGLTLVEQRGPSECPPELPEGG